MIAKIFFGLFLAIYLSGCLQNTSNLTPPKWFVSVPQDNSNLYGNGTGKTLEESKQNAINDLSSNIKVKVSADTTIINTQNDYKQHSEISQNIQLTLEAIELQDITLVNSEYKNNQYYSQVKISKKTLLLNLKNQYRSIYQNIQAFASNTCNSISIKDRNKLVDLMDKLNSIREIIYTLDSNSSLHSIQEYQNILNQNSPLPKARLIFTPQNQNDIANALSSEYAKFIKNSDEKNIYTIKNNISVQTQNNMVKITLQVNIYDCQNNIIFHTQIHSIQNNRADAISRLNVQLYKKLQEFSQSQQSSIPQI